MKILFPLCILTSSADFFVFDPWNPLNEIFAATARSGHRNLQKCCLDKNWHQSSFVAFRSVLHCDLSVTRESLLLTHSNLRSRHEKPVKQNNYRETRSAHREAETVGCAHYS